MTSDPPRRRRRLAAILMADVVGFSRMMGRDEEGTTGRILAFHELMRDSIESHGGRVVGTAGDSVFGDFDSILEALECSVSIQRSLHDINAGREAEERLDARIGLHLGDVIVEERNVFGDGVNVAARLEQLADPGGIMLSEAVYQVVRGRTDVPIEGLGVRTLKNIDEPIGVYRIGPDAFGDAPAPARAQARPRSETNVRIRDAIARIAESAADRAEGAAVAAGDDEDDTVVVDNDLPIRSGTLPVLVLGVLGFAARFSGWSENPWYPFLGSLMLGLGVGAISERLIGRRGVSSLIMGLALAGGALFHEGFVPRGIAWVFAAGMLGTGITRLAGRSD